MSRMRKRRRREAREGTPSSMEDDVPRCPEHGTPLVRVRCPECGGIHGIVRTGERMMLHLECGTEWQPQALLDAVGHPASAKRGRTGISISPNFEELGDDEPEGGS